jgi:hypothetical protein
MFLTLFDIFGRSESPNSSSDLGFSASVGLVTDQVFSVSAQQRSQIRRNVFGGTKRSVLSKNEQQGYVAACSSMTWVSFVFVLLFSCIVFCWKLCLMSLVLSKLAGKEWFPRNHQARRIRNALSLGLTIELFVTNFYTYTVGRVIKKIFFGGRQ